MPRPKAENPPVKTHINIPQDLYARIGLELFSDVRGRIPHGEWSAFFERICRAHYAEIDKAAGILPADAAAAISAKVKERFK